MLGTHSKSLIKAKSLWWEYMYVLMNSIKSCYILLLQILYSWLIDLRQISLQDTIFYQLKIWNQYYMYFLNVILILKVTYKNPLRPFIIPTEVSLIFLYTISIPASVMWNWDKMCDNFYVISTGRFSIITHVLNQLGPLWW